MTDETAAVILGVDIGSSRIKAAAYDDSGRVVSAAEVDTPKVVSPDGEDFPTSAVLDAAVDVVRRMEMPAGSIAAVGITSMGEVGTVLGADGLADLAFPSWYDSRGAEVLPDLEDRFGTDHLLTKTGRHTRVVSTVAKLSYVVTRRDGPIEGTFVGLAGALAWLLTGRVRQEVSLAVSSGVYNAEQGEYLEDVWAAAGLGDVALPPVDGAGASAPASTALARELGIANSAPVVIAGLDHPVAAVGAGAQPGDVIDSMGTAEAVMAVVRGDRARDEALRNTALRNDPWLTYSVWPATGEPIAMWAHTRPGVAMELFLAHAGLSRDQAESDAPAPGGVELLDASVVESMERGGPGNLPPTVQSWGALIDYYVHVANRAVELVRECTGAAGPVLLTGGGLRSRRWRHAKALTGGAPLAVSGVRETATRGAAAIAGTAAGWWTDAASMPGAMRLPIRPGSTADIDAAVAAMRW